MTQVHYGVVKQGDRWTIIGDHLRVGGYADREAAIRAAERLARRSGGLPAQLHLQDESGVLLPPRPQAPLV